jgi:Na+/H+ antiporter NhaB
MPFVSLLVVFFGVVAIIEEQHIFAPIINIVLGLPTAQQPAVRAAKFFRPLFGCELFQSAAPT